jgi:hypothetical protein
MRSTRPTFVICAIINSHCAIKKADPRRILQTIQSYHRMQVAPPHSQQPHAFPLAWLSNRSEHPTSLYNADTEFSPRCEISMYNAMQNLRPPAQLLRDEYADRVIDEDPMPLGLLPTLFACANSAAI